MRYTIRFEGTAAEKEAQAWREVIYYLGDTFLPFYKAILSYALAAKRAGQSTAKVYRAIEFACSIHGIDGRWPVRSVARRIFQDIEKLTQITMEVSNER